MLAFWFSTQAVLAKDVAEVVDEQSIENLDSKLTTLVGDAGIPGIQMAMVKDNQIIWSKSYGVSNLKTQESVTPNTIFRAGSTSKTFVALAIMQLINQGKFDLCTPIRDLVPGVNFENPYAETHPVKVIHLLEHTAGFDDMRFANFFNTEDEGISMLDAVNRGAGSLYVRWQPGRFHSYSNPGYGILGHIIEAVSGQSYESYIDDNILKPMGMIRSSMRLTDSVGAALSKGYIDSNAVPFKDLYLRSAGSLNTTAEELALMVKFLLSRAGTGEISNIDRNTILQMESPSSTVTAKAGLEYGYGLGVYQTDRAGHKWYGHSGTVDGFFSYYAYSPDLNVGYTITMNSSSISVGGIIDAMVAYLVGGKEGEVPVDFKPIGKDIDGYYRVQNHRNELFAGLVYITGATKLTSMGNEVEFKQVLGNSWKVKHLGDNQFLKEGYAVPTGMFVKSSDSKDVVELNGIFIERVSAFSAYAPLVLAILVILSFLMIMIFAPIWIINLLRGKKIGITRVLLRLYPLLAILSLCLSLFAVSQLTPVTAAFVNWQTICISLGTVLFVVFGGLSIIQSLKAWKLEEKKIVLFLTAFFNIAIVISTIYLIAFNYFGIMLWAW